MLPSVKVKVPSEEFGQSCLQLILPNSRRCSFAVVKIGKFGLNHHGGLFSSPFTIVISVNGLQDIF